MSNSPTNKDIMTPAEIATFHDLTLQDESTLTANTPSSQSETQLGQTASTFTRFCELPYEILSLVHAHVASVSYRDRRALDLICRRMRSLGMDVDKSDLHVYDTAASLAWVGEVVRTYFSGQDGTVSIPRLTIHLRDLNYDWCNACTCCHTKRDHSVQDAPVSAYASGTLTLAEHLGAILKGCTINTVVVDSGNQGDFAGCRLISLLPPAQTYLYTRGMCRGRGHGIIATTRGTVTGRPANAIDIAPQTHIALGDVRPVKPARENEKVFVTPPNDVASIMWGGLCALDPVPITSIGSCTYFTPVDEKCPQGVSHCENIRDAVPDLRDKSNKELCAASTLGLWARDIPFPELATKICISDFETGTFAQTELGKLISDYVARDDQGVPRLTNIDRSPYEPMVRIATSDGQDGAEEEISDSDW